LWAGIAQEQKARWKLGGAADLTNWGSNPAALPHIKYEPQGEGEPTPEVIKNGKNRVLTSLLPRKQVHCIVALENLVTLSL
jgi:hypothetical protein